MGKADQKRTQNAITKQVDSGERMMNQGIDESSARTNQLTNRSDDERSQIWGNYSKAGAGDTDYYGGLSAGRPAPGGGGNTGTGTVGLSGGGGGGGATPAAGGSDYMSIWNALSGATGGFDPDRIGRVNSGATRLGNTAGNFGAADSSIRGLQNFASTGGVSNDQRNSINRDSLLEFERTGGYSGSDIANIRNRSNSGISSQFGALKDQLNRRRAISGGQGPGFDRSLFKLAREQAQAGAGNVRDTEIGINDSIRSGRMDAAKTLAANNLSLADLTSRNTLAGYGAAGDMDIRKQGQISSDIKSGADIDLGAQGLINNTRLGAASGMSQDANSKASIGASAGAAAAARDDANRRWAAEMSQRDREFGTGGMLSTYQARPEELLYNQNQLMDYRQGRQQVGQDEINNRINASRIPGLGSSIASGIGIAGQVAGMASGGLGGLTNFANAGINPYRPPTPGNPMLQYSQRG